MKRSCFIAALCILLSFALVFAGCAARETGGEESATNTEAAAPVTAGDTTDAVTDPPSTEPEPETDPIEVMLNDAVFKFGFTVSGVEFEAGDEMDPAPLAEFFRYVVMPDWESEEFVKEEYLQYKSDDPRGEYEYYIPRGVIAEGLAPYFDLNFTGDPDELIGIHIPIGTEVRATKAYPRDGEVQTEGAANVIKCYGDDRPFQGIFSLDDGKDAVYVDIVTRTFTLGVILRDDMTYKFSFCRDFATHYYNETDVDPLTPGVSTLDDLLAIAPEVVPSYSSENGTEKIYVGLPVSGGDDMLVIFSPDGVLEEIRMGA